MKFFLRKLTLKIIPVSILPVVFCSCQSGIGIFEAGEKEFENYYSTFASGSDFSVAAQNILGNYLLYDALGKREPELLIKDMENIFRRDRRREVQSAIAETAMFLADKYHKFPERRAGLLLTALMHCTESLRTFDRDKSPVFSPEKSRVLTIYNRALTGLFCYLKDRKIALNYSFTLTAAGGQEIFFVKPFIKLPLKSDFIREFIPCAFFRPRNLTHAARNFGIGVPLIGEIKPGSAVADPASAGLCNIPATLLFNMEDAGSIISSGRLRGRLEIIDSREYDFLVTSALKIPLEQDFSTPLALGAVQNPVQNFIHRTLVPESNLHEGLYLLQARDRRIPVLFVHGLMSDIRTWLQMLNTLQSDPDIRRNYRFMGFSYSSGNPILFSAQLLREALAKERAKLVSSGIPPENFDRMIVIGHSMGGLLTRVLVSASDEKNVRQVIGNQIYDTLAKQLNAAQGELIGKRIFFQPFPSVKRAVFIASPHRGSGMAVSWYGRLGAKLVRLPGQILEQNKKIISILLGAGKKEYARELEEFNGIFNLAPDGMALKLLNSLPMPSIPFHSVIGNRKDNSPGGSDGVVAYSSSHLDGAASELIVCSGHSVQQNALAIQEIRRILLLHLKESGSEKIPADSGVFNHSIFPVKGSEK